MRSWPLSLSASSLSGPVAFLGSLLGLTARQRRFVRFALPFVQRRGPEFYVLASSGRNGLLIRGVSNFPQETSDMADHGDHSFSSMIASSLQGSFSHRGKA